VFFDRLEYVSSVGVDGLEWVCHLLRVRLDLLRGSILLIEYMLLDCIICLKKLKNKLTVFLPFDSQLINSLFQLNYSVSFLEEGILALGDGSVNLNLFFLTLFQLPFHLVDLVLLDSNVF
jgi:hypothetical protein